MDNEKRLAAWKEFVNGENIRPELSPLVANSWRRCWSFINPTQRLNINRLNADTLLAAQVASFDLISIARPILEDIYQSIDPSNLAVVLLNGTGYILDMLADSEMRACLSRSGITEGVLLTEGQVGTNAFGLALMERMPVEIVGGEHYSRMLHHLAAAAVPIFDITGRSLGICGLISPVSSYQSHSLGMMVACARCIEAQRQADVLLAEQNSQLAQLNAILDTITEGIVVWNGERILIHLNNFAARMIGIPIQGLVGLSIGGLLSYPPFIQRSIEKQEPLTDVEATIKIKDRALNCLISLRFVMNKEELQWIIATLRPIKEVRQLVQRQIGAQALMSLDDIPGESQHIKRVHQFVKSTAPAKACILIHGESGTGKNVLARAIHNESQRRDGPFVIIPCASIPAGLMLSELLGYEEGALPKRVGSRPSKFELAQGGTIFFQDVDALPLEAQAILLNVIELGVIQRLGSDRATEVDVRIIASTASNIGKDIIASSFRSDLYYRLSTFSIRLPPLRERPSDIPLIAQGILDRISLQLGRSLKIETSAMGVLTRYSWPGNIRELEAALGTAVAQLSLPTANSVGVIEQSNLSATLRSLKHHAPGSSDAPLVQSMNEVERETILQTARHCRGNMSQMAQILGMGRTTLWRKMKRYQILIDDYRKSEEELLS